MCCCDWQNDLLYCFYQINNSEYIDLNYIQEVLEQVQVYDVGMVSVGQVVMSDLYYQYCYLDKIGSDVQIVCVDQCKEC